MRMFRFAVLSLFAALLFAPLPAAAAPATGLADAAVPTDVRIEPAALAALLKGPDLKPLILQVGFGVLYDEAHITGAQYAGPTGKDDGIQNLKTHVDKLPRDRFIVIYCGCCPWIHCPNIGAAFTELHAMGFTNVKVLYLPQNFGDDWVSKGYPVEHGS